MNAKDYSNIPAEKFRLANRTDKHDQKFDTKAVGFGAVIVVEGTKDKKIGNFFPIIILTDTEDGYRVAVNPDII